MMKFALVASAALLGASLAGATTANAFTTIGVEGANGANGFVGNLFGNLFSTSNYLVASDGESSFDPFGFGADTSDGLNFSAVPFVWTQATGSTWTDLGNQTWVLPATIPGCGSENNTTCEPIGDFVSPTPWNPAAIGTWVIWDSANGPVSDVIKTFNNANGQGELWFSSDPSLLSIPEPSTWAMMLLGFAGLGFAGYRARAKIGALAV
jgi:hypothetical protein